MLLFDDPYHKIQNPFIISLNLEDIQGTKFGQDMHKLLHYEHTKL